MNFKELLLCIFLSASIFVIGCGSGSGSGREDENTALLAIKTVSPPPDATDVDVYSSINLNFSEYIDPSSVNENSVFVTLDGYLIPGTRSVNGRSIVFKPSDPFYFSKSYKVGVTNQIKGITGNHLGSEFSWDFITVSDNIRPTILKANIYEGMLNAPVNVVPTIWFNEDMNPESINSSSVHLINVASNTTVDGNVTYEEKVLRFNPVENLDFASKYRLFLDANISDVAGNVLYPYSSGISINFTTDIAPSSFFDFTLAPRELSIYTLQGGVAEVYFDIDLAAGSALPTSLMVKDCPPFATCEIIPNLLLESSSDKTDSARLLIRSSSQTPVGSYQVSLIAQGGDAVHSASSQLSITMPPPNGQPAKLWGDFGLSISVEEGHQLSPIAINSDDNEVIFLWEDSRVSHGDPDLYGQKLNTSGVSFWKENGLPLENFRHAEGFLVTKWQARSIPDGKGGFFLTWADNRLRPWNAKDDIYAQHFDKDGNELWQKGGIPVCTAGSWNNSKSHPQIVSDENGGVIITWWEQRDGVNFSVWSQRIDSDGNPIWAPNGVPVAYGDFYANFPKIISDGSNGAIIVWQDLNYKRLENRGDIMAQRINGQGEPLWTNNGVVVAQKGGASSHEGFSIIEDGYGGAIVTWVDGRALDPNESDIYAQKINENGAAQWEAGGIPICTNPGHEYYPAIVTDNNGGAIIVWDDQTGLEGTNISAQKIDTEGNTLWETNGKIIKTGGSAHLPKPVEDGQGGCIVVWNDISWDPFGPNILAQRLNSRGDLLWGNNGFEIFYREGGYYPYSPQAVSDGSGGAIIFWREQRYNDDWDIHAQRVKDVFN